MPFLAWLCSASLPDQQIFESRGIFKRISFWHIIPRLQKSKQSVDGSKELGILCYFAAIWWLSEFPPPKDNSCSLSHSSGRLDRFLLRQADIATLKCFTMQVKDRPNHLVVGGVTESSVISLNPPPAVLPVIKLAIRWEGSKSFGLGLSITKNLGSPCPTHIPLPLYVRIAFCQDIHLSPSDTISSPPQLLLQPFLSHLWNPEAVYFLGLTTNGPEIFLLLQLTVSLSLLGYISSTSWKHTGSDWEINGLQDSGDIRGAAA